MNKAYYNLDEAGEVIHVIISDGLGDVITEYKLQKSEVDNYKYANMRRLRKNLNAEIMHADSRIRDELSITIIKIKFSINRHGIYTCARYYSNNNSDSYSVSIDEDDIRWSIITNCMAWPDAEIQYENVPEYLRIQDS
jgi:hypothetical protein